MMNTRSPLSFKKGQGSELRNKRDPEKNSFVSKCSKTVNRTLNRRSSITKKEKKKSDVPRSRKITEYFFESPKIQVSSSNNNSPADLDLIGFRKGTLSPICLTSDSEVDHNDTENGSRTGYKFKNATHYGWKTIYFDGKPCKSEKYRDDKFTHSVNVSGEANTLTNNMEIEKATGCDIPSYQQIIKDKKDCDTYIHEVQNLVSSITSLSDTPEKSPGSYHYNTRSRSKSSSSEKHQHHGYQTRSRSASISSQSPKAVKHEIGTRHKRANSKVRKSRERQRKSPKQKISNFFKRSPKTKEKLESKVDSPNKMSAEKSKRKLNFQKFEKENCDQLSNISNKKSLPERSQDSCNSITRSRNVSSSSEKQQHHGYQTRSRSASISSQSPKAVKHEIRTRDKRANLKVRKSREKQRKSPKQKISNFFERSPKTKEKLKSKVDSPNKMPAEKSKRKLNFQKFEKENCDQLSNISNKKSLPERSQDSCNSISRSRSISSSSEKHQHHGYQTRSRSASISSQSPKAVKHEIRTRDKRANVKVRKSRERQRKSPKQKISNFFERSPKTKEKLESKVHSPNKMSAEKSKCKLNFQKFEKENCDQLSNIPNKKSLPERSQDSCNSISRSRSISSSSEKHQNHGYQTRSKSVSSNSQSPKATKHEIQGKNKKANSKVRKSRERQKKSPKQKISKFFKRTPKTKEKLESKVDSPNKMSAGKSKRKLNFEKLQKENCDQLPISSDKKSLESKKASTTFRRYGIYVPSYEDILNEKKNYDDYSNLVDSLTKLVVPLPEIKINDYDTQPVQIEVLNCKHMSKEALFRAYANNIQYMEDIISGKIFSERHEKYKSVFSREELTYNTSMITFTNEQKQLLVADLCEKFGETSTHSDYYFKVLLPELCLKIFMDEHAMSREEATEYLDCYPV